MPDIFDQISQGNSSGQQPAKLDIFDQIPSTSGGGTQEVEKLARVGLQGALGLGKGAVYTNPATAIPAGLGELAYKGAIEGTIGDVMESEREHQALYPGQLPKINEQALRKGSEEAEEKLLGGEGLVGGILSAPVRAAGIDTKPKDFLEKGTRDLTSLYGLLRGGGRGAAAEKAAGRGAIAGTISKESLESMGMPEWAADIFSLPATLGAAAGPIGKAAGTKPHKVQKGKEEVAQAIKESDLLPVKGAVNASKNKLLPEPLSSEKSLKIHKQKVDESVREATNKLIEEKIPISGLEKDGKELTEIRSGLYKEVREAAKQVPQRVDMSKVSSDMRSMVKELKSIPSANPKTKKLINNLQRKIKDFNDKPLLTADQWVTQHQEINDEISDLFGKIKMTRSDFKKVEALRSVNQKMMEQATSQLEKDSPEFTSLFRSANKFNTQYESLNSVRKILDPIMNKEGGISAASIKSALENPKKAKALTKAMGPESVNRIRRIGKYLESVDNLYDMYQVPSTDPVKLLQSLRSKDIAISVFSSLFGGGAGKLFAGGYFFSKWLRGKSLLSEKGSKDYEGMLKAIKDKNKGAFEHYAKQYQTDVLEDS